MFEPSTLNLLRIENLPAASRSTDAVLCLVAVASAGPQVRVAVTRVTAPRVPIASPLANRRPRPWVTSVESGLTVALSLRMT